MHPLHKGPTGQVVPSSPHDLPNFKELPLNYLSESPEPDTPHQARGSRFWASLRKFFFWWLGFAGIYAGSSVCPFCGQPTCPVGPGAAGLIGVFFAAVFQYGHRVKAYCRKIRESLVRG